MAWSSETPSYCGWNELHVKNARGKNEVHYYLERKDGIADLAIVGRVKNSKRMSFRYALKKNRSVLKKLKSKEDVANWLDSIVSGNFSQSLFRNCLRSGELIRGFIGFVSISEISEEFGFVQRDLEDLITFFRNPLVSFR